MQKYTFIKTMDLLSEEGPFADELIMYLYGAHTGNMDLLQKAKNVFSKVSLLETAIIFKSKPLFEYLLTHSDPAPIPYYNINFSRILVTVATMEERYITLFFTKYYPFPEKETREYKCLLVWILYCLSYYLDELVLRRLHMSFREMIPSRNGNWYPVTLFELNFEGFFESQKRENFPEHLENPQLFRIIRNVVSLDIENENIRKMRKKIASKGFFPKEVYESTYTGDDYESEEESSNDTEDNEENNSDGSSEGDEESSSSGDSNRSSENDKENSSSDDSSDSEENNSSDDSDSSSSDDSSDSMADYLDNKMSRLKNRPFKDPLTNHLYIFKAKKRSQIIKLYENMEAFLNFYLENEYENEGNLSNLTELKITDDFVDLLYMECSESLLESFPKGIERKDKKFKKALSERKFSEQDKENILEIREQIIGSDLFSKLPKVKKWKINNDLEYYTDDFWVAEKKHARIYLRYTQLRAILHFTEKIIDDAEYVSQFFNKSSKDRKFFRKMFNKLVKVYSKRNKELNATAPQFAFGSESNDIVLEKEELSTFGDSTKQKGVFSTDSDGIFMTKDGAKSMNQIVEILNKGPKTKSSKTILTNDERELAFYTSPEANFEHPGLIQINDVAKGNINDYPIANVLSAFKSSKRVIISNQEVKSTDPTLPFGYYEEIFPLPGKSLKIKINGSNSINAELRVPGEMILRSLVDLPFDTFNEFSEISKVKRKLEEPKYSSILFFKSEFEKNKKIIHLRFIPNDIFLSEFYFDEEKSAFIKDNLTVDYPVRFENYKVAEYTSSQLAIAIYNYCWLMSSGRKIILRRESEIDRITYFFEGINLVCEKCNIFKK